MPEFILNTPSAKRPVYNDFDDFAKGYVEAMFFTNCDCGDEKRENHANELGVDRLTNKSLQNIKAQCADFQVEADALLQLAYEQDYDEAEAGRDFWFTRQGHGVGYWDREALEVAQMTINGPMSIGDQLSKIAKTFGEANCDIYRGWITHD